MTRATPGDLIAVYADESCLGNGREGNNPGGAGGLLEWSSGKGGDVTRFEFWISEPATTNNRMALRSVIEAFAGISARGQSYRVVFTTDSRYIVDGMRSWVQSWIARGWRRKGGPIENLELWKKAVSSVAPHDCDWRWVRGHDGHPQNEYANFLATRAAADHSNSAGLRLSGFDGWLAEQKNGATPLKEVAPLPDIESFSPSAKHG